MPQRSSTEAAPLLRISPQNPPNILSPRTPCLVSVMRVAALQEWWLLMGNLSSPRAHRMGCALLRTRPPEALTASSSVDRLLFCETFCSCGSSLLTPTRKRARCCRSTLLGASLDVTSSDHRVREQWTARCRSRIKLATVREKKKIGENFQPRRGPRRTPIHSQSNTDNVGHPLRRISSHRLID